jgi:hypothetical protein
MLDGCKYWNLREHDLASINQAPLGMGMLTGKFNTQTAFRKRCAAQLEFASGTARAIPSTRRAVQVFRCEPANACPDRPGLDMDTQRSDHPIPLQIAVRGKYQRR